MSIKQNKALIHRFFEEGPSNPDICDDVFAPVVQWQALNHTTGSPDFDSDP